MWAGRSLIRHGAQVIAPQSEADLFSDVQAFWDHFTNARYHDYAQQTTKVLTEPIAVTRFVQDEETITWQGLPIRVLATPGYTQGSVTYLVDLDGHRIAFPGDLIYGDGKLLDLYSLQMAIPAAKVGGYHGYAGRLGDLVASLRRIAAEKPTLMIPSRGPVIHDPIAAIDRLLARLQALYRNYLATDALRWYFGMDHIQTKAARVLGADAKLDLMAQAETFADLPSWIVPLNNSRLLLSADRSGFLIDCGSQQIIDRLKELQAAGQLTFIEHVFITHYHDDHTDQVANLVRETGATVHASRRNWDLLQNPGSYRLPCLTRNPVHVSGRAESGTKWRWKEFELALFYFPGQTLYHDALLVTRDSGEQIFFIGDSFTPCGIDDYCLQNRNIVREGNGFLACLELLEQEAPDALLINQHVEPAFRFSREQRTRMRENLKQREDLLQSLFPWDDPNYGIDEGWARFYPYACALHPGDATQLSLRILNHSPGEHQFTVKLHLPTGWQLDPNPIDTVRIPARMEGAISLGISIPRDTPPGQYVLTADVAWNQWELCEWSEAIVRVDPTPPP